MSSLIETMSLNEGPILNLNEMIFSLIYGITAGATIGKKTKHQEELISVMKEAIYSLMKKGVLLISILPLGCSK